MARRDDSALSTALAIGVFIAVVATWLFIPPSIIRSAWQTERSEVYALAGPGEHLIFRQAMNGLQQSMAKEFREFLLEADAMGEGALGNSSFSQWTRLRIEATWLWMGLVVYRLHVLMGWLLPGIPLAIVAYLDGQYVREIRKFSFVAQSPIRHKLGMALIFMISCSKPVVVEEKEYRFCRSAIYAESDISWNSFGNLPIKAASSRRAMI